MRGGGMVAMKKGGKVKPTKMARGGAVKTQSVGGGLVAAQLGSEEAVKILGSKGFNKTLSKMVGAAVGSALHKALKK
jgi:hypothetical protein